MSLAKFPPSGISPSGLWICSLCDGMDNAPGAGKAEGESTFTRVFTGNPLWCGKIKKGQSTDVGYALKGLRCESTWKLLPPSVYLHTSEILLRWYSESILRHAIICICCMLSTKKKSRSVTVPVTDCVFSEGCPQVLVCSILRKSGNDKLCCINSCCVITGVK